MGKLEKLIEQFASGLAEASFEDVRYILQAFGFEEKRSKGSHHIFANDRGQAITIPKKGGRKVKKVYFKRIVELLNLETQHDNIESEVDEESENNERSTSE
jgi:predicted RNA binding protein YcfA (HicA-like mRNA interferase family)